MDHFYVRTFRARRVQFKDAYYNHRALKISVDRQNELRTKGEPDPRKKKMIKKKLALQLNEIWQGLNGIPCKHPTHLTSCIALTMPAEYVGFMWKADGIPAALAFELIMGAIQEIDWDDDLEVRKGMATAWAKFEEFRRKADEIQGGFGCSEGGAWFTLRDIAEEPSSDRTFQDKMLDIANLAGKMLAAMGYSEKLVKTDDDESVRGLTVGGDIPRLVPVELAAMTDPEQSDLASMRILTKQAQQHQTEGETPQGRGPFVICIDESGSMAEEMDYQSPTRKYRRGRHTWSKAAAMALVRIAWNEDRAVRIIHFSGSAVVQDMPKDDARALFEMARTFLNGGTDFDIALSETVKQMCELELDGYPGADVVVISDGETYGNHQQLELLCDKLQDRDAELWSVAIGQDWPDDFPLRKRAKKYVHATDHRLQNVNTAAQLAVGLDDAAKAVVDPHQVN